MTTITSSKPSILSRESLLKRFPVPAFNSQRRDIVEWAEENLFLPIDTTRPGQLILEEFQKDILRAIQDDEVEEIVLMFPAQTCKSFLINIWIGWIIDVSPTNILLYQPTGDTSKKFQQTKLHPFLKATPHILNKITSLTQGKPISLDGFDFAGYHFITGSYGSSAKMKSVTGKIVFADEIEEIKSNDDASDPISLLKARSSGYTFGRKLIIASTPRMEGYSVIESKYNEGSKEEWWIPCPHCGEFVLPDFDNDVHRIITPSKIDGNPPRVDGTYQNRCCGAEWTDRQRFTQKEKGKWIAQNPEERKIRSFHISRLTAGYTKLSELVKESRGNSMGFYTQVLGLPYKPVAINPIEVSQIEKLHVDASPLERVTAITMSVDVQKDRLEYQVMEHDRWTDQAHIVEHMTIPQTTDLSYSWAQLAEVTKKHKPCMTFIDIGYDPSHMKDNILEREDYIVRTIRNVEPWSDLFWRKRVKLTRGLGSYTSTQTRFIMKEPKQDTENYDLILGTHMGKSRVISLLNEGKMTIARGKVTKNFNKQLVNEYLAPIEGNKGKKPEVEWKKVAGQRNEAFDCAYMNMCALKYLGVEHDRSGGAQLEMSRLINSMSKTSEE